MADFIIKPTSGNLILKDDQNVARMTIAPTSGTTTLSNLTHTSLPVGSVLKVNAFNDQTQVQIASGAAGGKCIEVDFTAQADNSAYYFGCTMVTTTNSSGSSNDHGDRAVTAWLEDASNANKYRFGYRKTTSLHHKTGSPETGILVDNDYYMLADSDAGYLSSTLWNESHYSWSWVAGNQPSEETTTVVNSAFGAGDTITLQVWLACMAYAVGYNKTNYGNASNGSRSVFSIIEVAT